MKYLLILWPDILAVFESMLFKLPKYNNNSSQLNDKNFGCIVKAESSLKL